MGSKLTGHAIYYIAPEALEKMKKRMAKIEAENAAQKKRAEKARAGKRALKAEKIKQAMRFFAK